MSISFRTTKLPSLKLKDQPKPHLGYLPLAFEPLDSTILKMRAGEIHVRLFSRNTQTPKTILWLSPGKSY